MKSVAYILAADSIERRFELTHLPEGFSALASIVLLILLLATVIYLYRREQRAGASRRVRAVLGGLRCAVILLLALIWLQPVLATYIRRTIESTTLLLVDGSASMGLRDRYPDPADAGRVQKVLGDAAPGDAGREDLVSRLLTGEGQELLARLAANNPVRVFAFGDRLTPIGEVPRGGRALLRAAEPGEPSAEAPDTQPAEPETGPLVRARAPATDIGRAVRGAIEAQGGAPVAAVVVLSDGRFNQGEPAEVVARYARGKKIPVHAVGVGDPSPPRNATVTSIEAPPNVFVKDPFKVVANLRAQGLDGASLTVELVERRRNDAQGSVVDTKRVQVGPGGVVEPVSFNRQIESATEMMLAVRVVPDAGETLIDDNQKETTVRALDTKMRVLLISGGPTWEYRYLSRLLARDATIDVSCWLQSADEDAVRDGNTIIDHLPRTPEELFGYACIILLDPDPRDFDATWTANVESLVGSYGGGLIYVAGRKFASQFAHDPNTRALLDLLPVVFDPNESDLIINELGHFQSTAWPLNVPPEAMASPVLAMADSPNENAQVWGRMPGVYWHYPVRREKPVATVFLRHSSPRMRNSYGGHVLLASQFFGSGRTGFLAFDTTWRWRRLGDRYFNRFWIQLIRHLVEGKLLSGQDRGLIQVERDTYAVGDAVTVEARLLDARHQPMQTPQVQATIRLDGQADRMLTLTAQPNRPGWYRGRFTPTDVGTHVLQIDLPGDANVKPASIRSQVRVGQPDLEFKQPELDRESLQALATGSAGGRYFEIDEAADLPAVIPSRTTTLVLTGQPVNLWDRWWTLALLVVLLGTEWGVRKWARLL